MKTFVRNTCLWIFFLMCSCLLAQKDFHFENFNTRNGLSHNEVRSILRDKRGFLWLIFLSTFLRKSSKELLN